MQASDDAINSITRNQIAELKSLSNPPEAVKQVTYALLVLFDSESLDWISAKKFISNPSFKSMLTNFDKENVSDYTINKVDEYASLDFFQPNNVAKVNMAAAQIAHWIMCVVEFVKMSKLMITTVKAPRVMREERPISNPYITRKSQSP